MILLSLVGEQPIPVLLVARALKPQQHQLCFTETTRRVATNLAIMLPGSRMHAIEPYDLSRAHVQLTSLVASETILNLTGGTKPMAMAAYEAARSKRLPVVYLQSEGAATQLFRYDFQDGQPHLSKREELPVLITINDYLEAHGLQPLAYKGPQNAQEAGLRRWLEKQVDECLTNVVFDSFEIDFILRRGNQVAVMEAKMKASNTRQGIDQLNTIAGRDYLGAYTGKIHVVARSFGPQLSRLAEARHIHIVVLSGKLDQRTGRLLLDNNSKTRLLAVLDQLLGPRLYLKIHNPQFKIK
jgi:hypothetical protein